MTNNVIIQTELIIKKIHELNEKAGDRMIKVDITNEDEKALFVMALAGKSPFVSLNGTTQSFSIKLNPYQAFDLMTRLETICTSLIEKGIINHRKYKEGP